MATQGLVTIRKGGEVAIKIVAGCNGMRAGVLTSAIRRRDRVPGLREAYDLAQQADFGCRNCLVVVGAKRSFYRGVEPLSRLYRRTFKRPRFNLRWKFGTADHVRVVNL